MWGISILADFRPMGIRFHALVVFGLSKDLLFESVLGHCGMETKMLLQKVIQLNVPLVWTVVGSVNQQAIGHRYAKKNLFRVVIGNKKVQEIS